MSDSTTPATLAVAWRRCLAALVDTLAHLWDRLLHLFIAAVLQLTCRLAKHSAHRLHRRQPLDVEQPTGRRLCQPKPEWVRARVLYLKALMPEKGCRKVAAIFNHLHGHRETVSKSYVANALKRKQEEMLRLRASIKHRRPWPVTKNHTWGLDLTHVPGKSGLADRLILRVLDHGTRACLLLREFPDKSTLTILRALLDAFRVYGRPSRLRTDNEPTLCSIGFRLTLALCGVRQQRIAPFCPWQNGRIERFYATLKSRLLRWVEQAGVPSNYQCDLDTFRAWYNHLRPHQHLDGLTPAHAWDATAPRPGSPAFYVSAWGELLTGFHPLS